MHLRQGGTRETFKFVSVVPVWGAYLLWVGAGLLHRAQQPVLMWLAIALSLFETGGLHWFVGTFVHWQLTGWPKGGERTRRPNRMSPGRVLFLRSFFAISAPLCGRIRVPQLLKLARLS
jgi:hypothetical protein